MKSEIIKSIGSSSFIVKYPLLFSLVVFIGTELVMLAFGFSTLSNFADNPLIGVIILLLKLAVFVALSYGYIYIRNHKKKRI